jgi:NADH-quinone oxidoreductase subunit N
MLMLPELIVIATAFAVLLVDLLLTERRRTVLAPLALLGLGAATVATLVLMPQAGTLFGGRFGVDAVAWWFKLIFVLVALITVGLSLDLLDGRVTVPVPGLGSRGEFYTTLLFTVAGSMFLISSRDIVTLYVSLELATIPLFVLAAWRRDARSGEAGLKYVIVGALASALLLYGLSLLYGLTGTTDMLAMSRSLTPSPMLWLAVALVAAGIGFKMTIVPFHMWAADVYEGAPTPITAYLSVASKAAGLALAFQILYRILGHFVVNWSFAFALFAAITMTLGNVVAITQRNIKRFMAFSGISQAGYLLMGFIGPAPEGVPAMLFYLVVYLAANMAVFAVIMIHSNQTGREEIKDYRGLARTNPLTALGMMLALFALAGIPPLAGFVGKFFLFSIASRGGFHWLVAVAAVNSTVSLYYYLQIVRQMYVEAPDASTQPLRLTPVLATVLGVTVAGNLLLGVIPFFYQAVHLQTITWLAYWIR